jgi:hypothetical protein
LKIRKGEVVISISPNDYPRFKKSGWKQVKEPTREQNKIMNEKAKAKRLAKMELEKGGKESC